MHAPVDARRAHAAPALDASPGPPGYKLSSATSPGTRQTRTRVLAPPVADDRIAGFPRPCRQSSPLHAPIWPSLTSSHSSLAPP
jgi:hypothetical protein